MRRCVDGLCVRGDGGARLGVDGGTSVDGGLNVDGGTSLDGGASIDGGPGYDGGLSGLAACDAGTMCRSNAQGLPICASGAGVVCGCDGGDCTNTFDVGASCTAPCSVGCSNGASCRASCQGGHCPMTCEGTAACAFHCQGGRCSQRIEDSSGPAIMSCAGGRCVMACVNSSCELSCAGGNCDIWCLDGAQCTANCFQNCTFHQDATSRLSLTGPPCATCTGP